MTNWKNGVLQVGMLGLSACAAQPIAAPDCPPGSSGSCESQGARRCSRQGDAVETCFAIGPGCLQWQPTAPCGPQQECLANTESDAVCVCRHECAPDAPATCQGNHIFSCRTDRDGCRTWEATVHCGATGHYCEARTKGSPRCIDPCVAPCPNLGALRCQGEVLQQCQKGEGCQTWKDVRNCQALGRTCEAHAETASCQCREPCPLGERRCGANDVIEQCVFDQIGCQQWAVVHDCRALHRSCEQGELLPHCRCPDTCERGATRCADSLLQECGPTREGCLDWRASFDCASVGLTCGEAQPSAECITGQGDSCNEARVLWRLPSRLSGSSVAESYTDQGTFTGEGCLDAPGQPEAILALDLSEAQVLRVQLASGSAPVQLLFSTTCDPAAACEAAAPLEAGGSFDFVAPRSGRSFVVLTWDVQVTGLPFDITFQIADSEALAPK